MTKLANLIDAAADVGYTAEDRAHIVARAKRHALKLAGIATACWYLLWFGLSINLSAWAGLAIFVITYMLGYGFAQMMLQRAASEEIQRRRDLRKVAENYRKQRDSTT